MSDKIIKSPQIRFAGFTDAWEQRKFSELFGERRDKTKVENEDTLLSCAISGMFLNTELFGHFRGSSTIGYLKVKKNDLILSAQNLHLGNANVNLRFEHGIISPAYKVYEIIDSEPNFIQAWVKRDKTKNFFLAATTEGASQCRKNIEWDRLYKQTMFVPVYKEQEAIGTFFGSLDNLINFYQRKLELLKDMKKSLLQKMFPKDGANVPEIRFAGFTDAWEQRRLNEYLTTSKLKNRDERFGKEDVLSVSGDFGIVNQIEFQGRSFAGASVAPYGIVETGDVVYTKSPLKSNPFGIIKTNKGQAGIVSTLYAVYKPNNNVDSKFVERYFENDQRLNRYLKPLVNKGAKNDMKVSDDNALIGTVVFPVEVDEQRKISSLFNQLDNLISLHQRELNSLKNLKKSLLQQMFI